MTAKRIHHIAFVFHDLDKAIELFEKLFAIKINSRQLLPSRGVEVATFPIGETIIELITPVRKDSPVKEYLDKHGEGFFHIAFEEDNIEGKLAYLRQQGFEFLDKSPRKALNNWRVAFLDPKQTFGIHLQIVEP
ncbi:VOC family protein [Calderihabitans maritimus]|uniref:VOC domain-containing protein n=1 Tax=Calderihabitans maritimus TaxID=1246530 RepID=A0A1Z5HS41_9FIRM|nr:VOC family protein [Calderihabitans maritimus]GAW92334.1 hypothetical protein KKC1_14890 [Calderihabitans maritimus]